MDSISRNLGHGRGLEVSSNAWDHTGLLIQKVALTQSARVGMNSGDSRAAKKVNKIDLDSSLNVFYSI